MGVASEGIVHEEAAGMYLCQNAIEGGLTENKHGYAFSWYVQSGSEEDMLKWGVRQFKLHK